MYVCVCLAVTEQEVEAAIAGGAHTRTSVTAACRAGGDCGACHQMIEEMVEDHLESSAQACALPCEQSGPIHTGPALVAADALVRTRAA